MVICHSGQKKTNTDFIIESVDKKSTLSNAMLLSKFLISVTNPIVFFGSLFEQYYTLISTLYTYIHIVDALCYHHLK